MQTQQARAHGKGGGCGVGVGVGMNPWRFSLGPTRAATADIIEPCLLLLDPIRRWAHMRCRAVTRPVPVPVPPMSSSSSNVNVNDTTSEPMSDVSDPTPIPIPIPTAIGPAAAATSSNTQPKVLIQVHWDHLLDYPLAKDPTLRYNVTAHFLRKLGVLPTPDATATATMTDASDGKDEAKAPMSMTDDDDVDMKAPAAGVGAGTGTTPPMSEDTKQKVKSGLANDPALVLRAACIRYYLVPAPPTPQPTTTTPSSTAMGVTTTPTAEAMVFTTEHVRACCDRAIERDVASSTDPNRPSGVTTKSVDDLLSPSCPYAPLWSAEDRKRLQTYNPRDEYPLIVHIMLAGVGQPFARLHWVRNRPVLSSGGPNGGAYAQAFLRGICVCFQCGARDKKKLTQCVGCRCVFFCSRRCSADARNTHGPHCNKGPKAMNDMVTEEWARAQLLSHPRLVYFRWGC